MTSDAAFFFVTIPHAIVILESVLKNKNSCEIVDPGHHPTPSC